MWSHRDPSLRKSGLGNIFVKCLAPTIDNKTLFDTFSMFGNILSCKVATNYKRESLGYGFVHYENEESAQQAISRVNGKMIAGKQVSVTVFKSKKERGGNQKQFTNVYVKNLPDDITKERLEEIFAKYGDITSSYLGHSNTSKLPSKPFGFVNFKNAEDASNALTVMHESEWEEQKLYVARAQKRDDRDKELRDHFEQLKVDRAKKYAGVNLYVKNLGDEMDEARLRELFAKCGNIINLKIMVDPATNKSRGFGFVCFSSTEEATKAVTDMNGRMVENKPLYVALAQRKPERRAQLEAQYAARAKMSGMPQQHMYPQGMPMAFYQGGPQRMMYPPMGVVSRRWQPTPQQMMSSGMGGGAQIQRQLVPLHQQGGGRGNVGGPKHPRGRGQQGKMGMGGPPRGYVLNAEARNQPSPAVATDHSEPLTLKALAQAPEQTQKQLIGERLYPLIEASEPSLAGKITGMLLEMDNGELLHLLTSHEALNEKIREALSVLRTHEAQSGGQALQ